MNDLPAIDMPRESVARGRSRALAELRSPGGIARTLEIAASSGFATAAVVWGLAVVLSR